MTNQQQRLTREQVDTEKTWNIQDIFQTEKEFETAMEQVDKDVLRFLTYKGELAKNAETLLTGLQLMERILVQLSHLGNYAGLQFATDGMNSHHQARYTKANALITKVEAQLAFVKPELLSLPNEVIRQYIEAEPGLMNYEKYLFDIVKQKPHILSLEVEEALSSFGELMQAPGHIYEQSKSADMIFRSFEDENGQNLPMSETLYEDKYEIATSTTVRRNAYASYMETLNQYKNTYAATYQTEVTKQITMARLRGYESVTDMLLEPQDVTQQMYHQQLDIIQEELAPHMRKYARLKQEAYDLDTLQFADLKAPFDPTNDPDISFPEASRTIEEALAVMGEEYKNMVHTAFEDRWIDAADNIGKQSGAFCAHLDQIHPYILISWTDKMRSMFILAHELGHAGHFHLADQQQTILNMDPSTYFVEAPSTFNELLLADHLLAETDDKQMKQWIITQLLDTYYHNFVTHLLEGEFQRRVYTLAEKGTPLTTSLLCEQKREVLQSFWGDSVQIDENAGLTWMRQPHYYMGLYPYTYSAGLTIATAMMQKVKSEGETAIQDWRHVLQQGGSLSPLELTKMAGIDMTNPKTIQDAVRYVGDLVDQLGEE